MTISPVYNMGGSPYNNGALNVLAFGYDTIEGGFDAVAHDDAKDVLASLKAEAQVKDQSVPWPLGGLAVEPRSLRPWSWVLTNDLYHLRISRSRKIHSGFRLLSCGLASEGWRRLLELVESDLMSICGARLPHPPPSRPACRVGAGVGIARRDTSVVAFRSSGLLRLSVLGAS